ncbi:MAG: ABC transporter ATP-binding protein [Acidobacteriota bacterium]
MSTIESIIRLRGVEKAFGPKEVLRGIDLDVDTGESLVILGGSGSGKSVLLKHMIRLLRPDTGTVEVDGVDLATLSDRQITNFRRRFGMSFQEGALFDSMTVYENVAFPLRRSTKMSRSEIDARVAECLDMVDLEQAGHKLPSELSGGMRRRVGFARSIALEPKILLFDEPTTGLDPVLTAIIDQVIISLRKQLGSTTVTITHDLNSAFRIADRLAMLHGGQIIEIGPPNAFRASTNPFVQQFLAGSAEGPLHDG